MEQKKKPEKCYICKETKEIPIYLRKGDIKINVCEECYKNHTHEIENELFFHNKKNS